MIGQGAYGTVFRARDAEGAFVVIKQLFDTGSGSPEDFAYQRKLFWREADILSQINHPKIVRFIERIPDDKPHSAPPDGDLFLVLELVQGPSLRKVFDEYRAANNNQPFPAETVVAVGTELCEALDYVHRMPGQIIYRDLKPENVMWDAQNQVCKLVDFGTARFSAKNRKVTQGLGTEGYAPPELYSTRADVTFSADVFTIGALMYELLTGETPEPKMTPRDFRGFDPRIPDGLENHCFNRAANGRRAALSNCCANGRCSEKSGYSKTGCGFGSRRRRAREKFASVVILFLPGLRHRAAHRARFVLRQMSRADSYRNAARAFQKRAAEFAVFAKRRNPFGPHRPRFGRFSRCRFVAFRSGPLCQPPSRQHQAQRHAVLY